jgi:hypothetical protein
VIGCLLAYDATGHVVATLDHVVARNEAGEVIGLVDFAAHEDAGGQLVDIWTVDGASGSGTWPEWLGSAAHDFRVELAGKRIAALVHKASGHRRVRDEVEQAIAATPVDEQGRKDLRAIVGGPDRHLHLDDEGKTAKHRPVQRSDLPLLGVGRR